MRLSLKFEGDISNVLQGIESLTQELDFTIDDGGIAIWVEKWTLPELVVSYKAGQGRIKYNENIHLYRGLGLFIDSMSKGNDFYISEEPQFTSNGVMYDCSRNAVLTVSSVQFMLRKMAIMGLNMMMLYTEDNYEIEGEPYFGHFRGRYSHKELQEIDDYAHQFGIEVIPCMQTLGHLQTVLKWPVYSSIAENDKVIIPGEPETYAFIEKMIKAASAPFRSRRIHIGMDEAWGMGLGKHLEKHGYQDRFEIFTKHLEKVNGIAAKLGLSTMIWSDMYFRVGSKDHLYLDLNANIPAEVTENVPDGVQLVYWDYYTQDESFFSQFINKHKEFGSIPVYSGGILHCSTFCTNYESMFLSMNPALNACKKEGVTEVFATVWADDAAENNHFSTLLGMQFFAEHGYAKDLDITKLQERVLFCTGIDYDAFMDLSKLDRVGGENNDNRWPPNVCKYALWQDPMLGLYDKDISSLNLNEHYRKLAEAYEGHRQSSTEADLIFGVPHRLASVLSIKSEFGIRMKQYYDEGNKDELDKIVKIEIPLLIDRLKQLREEHRRQWFASFKAIGWEVLDLRYSGLIGRIESAGMRLVDYLQGKVDRIEELDVERLRLDSTEAGLGHGIWKKYPEIATANVL